MKVEQTERGFNIIEFVDANGKECSLQESSAIDETARGLDEPGSSFLWLGTNEQRMHLSREQVMQLAHAMNVWVRASSLKPRQDFPNESSQ